MIVNKRIQLIDLMKELQLPLNVCEVGVAEGRFSINMWNEGIDKLYLIDIWEQVPFISGCASFEQKWHNENYDKVFSLFENEIGKEKVVILKGFSYQMAKYIPDNSLGLIYIDCDHTYNGVRTDIDYFMPKLVKGGIMGFHDYDITNTNYGVVAAVHDYTKGIGITEIIEDGKPENRGAYIIKQ